MQSFADVKLIATWIYEYRNPPIHVNNEEKEPFRDQNVKLLNLPTPCSFLNTIGICVTQFFC